ncbi:diamine acetyltransferase 2-like [Limulus polyphemus]|uniref:Diamine acetyltransferase 2-like n=1 Tax=Limulus polyphemus TaxID=6850 RepID=A0ABM1S817_LIMPO|nr:diamine acetyltransferase 2-like [Limulus polyphemus]
MSLFSIRPATKDDCKDIVRLMKEMAENERMPNGFKVDEKTLQKDGFGKRPFYYCFVAELNKEELSAGIVGYVLYFFTYSTWEGRSIYVQDLYVSPQYRRRGMGSALQKRTVQAGIENECSRVNFALLNRNTFSIEFYKKQGAIDLTETEGWNVFRLKKDDLFRLAEK